MDPVARPGPHSGPRARPPRELRRAAVAEFEALLLQGHAPRAAKLALQAKYGVARRTAMRWAQLAGHQLRQRCEGRRDDLVARQVARLEDLMRRALDHEEVVVTAHTDAEGKEHKRATRTRRPDLRAYLAAIVEQDKLLGLHPPTLEERYLDAGASLVREVFEVLRGELGDPAVLRRLAERMRDALRRHRRPAADGVVVDAQASEIAVRSHGAGAAPSIAASADGKSPG